MVTIPEPTAHPTALVCPYCRHEHAAGLARLGLTEHCVRFLCRRCGRRFRARVVTTQEYQGWGVEEETE